MAVATIVTPPQVRTIGYVLQKLAARFGKTDLRLEAQIVPEISDRMREICAEYPYWFMTVEPGMVITQGFPYNGLPPATTPCVDPATGLTSLWADQGWLLVVAGQEDYPMFTQADFSTGTSLLAPSEVRQLQFCKRFSLTGSMECDLPVVTSDVYLSNSTAWGSATQQIQAPPSTVNVLTRGGVSYLRFAPIPDQDYLMACSWSLATPPWYYIAAQQSITNLVCAYYPRVLECLVGIAYADFFKEDKAEAKYKMELFGESMGRVRANINNHGIIGTMRMDTNNRLSQTTQEVEWFPSSRPAVGRNGPHRRQPYDSFYTSPLDY